MKKLAVVLVFGAVLLGVIFSSAYAKGPPSRWQGLDIDLDGNADYLYLVFSAKVGKEYCTTVQFDNLNHTYEGAEVWFETSGVILDSFDGGDYDFPWTVKPTRFSCP